MNLMCRVPYLEFRRVEQVWVDTHFFGANDPPFKASWLRVGFCPEALLLQNHFYLYWPLLTPVLALCRLRHTPSVDSFLIVPDRSWQVIVKTEVQEAPRDVAVDFTRRKVYWTALCCGLRRANLDGSDEEIVASAEFASGVAILNGSVFWADWMHGQIFRRDMGNSGTEEPIVTGLASPVDVAVDPQNQQIYWSDVGIARTQRASPDGSDIQVLNMSWAIMNTYGTWRVDSEFTTYWSHCTFVFFSYCIYLYLSLKLGHWNVDFPIFYFNFVMFPGERLALVAPSFQLPTLVDQVWL